VENVVKIAAACAVACLIGSSPVFAAVIYDTTTQPPAPAPAPAADRPSPESLHHLLEVMQARKTVEVMAQQLDATITASLNQLVDNKTATPQQRQVIEKCRARMADMFKEFLSWDVMEPLYLKVYGDTFSQAEIDGMTAFYAGPIGHAMIVKMPLAMKNSMSEAQKRIGVMIPRIQQMTKETAEEIKALRAASADGKSG
jgi:hypothetical protein